jgi:iron complex outermembrane receptor protein
MDHWRVALVSVATAGWTVVAAAAAANDRATEDAAHPHGPMTIEPVVVTAERRSRSLQEVPISIRAFTAEELDGAGANDLEDLQYLAPGLVVTKNSGLGNVYVRGIGSDIVGAALEGAVAVYVDGVYQARPGALLYRFLDVERIEVLKGPQGTLYGRNSTGGAINIVSRQPARGLEGQADATVASFSERQLRAGIGGTLVDGVAYGRLAIIAAKNDGTTLNALSGTRGNDIDERGVHGAVTFTPGRDLSLTFDARYYDSSRVPLLKPLHPGTTPALTRLGATVIDDPFTVRHDATSQADGTQSSMAATLRWGLGCADFTSVTSYNTFRSTASNDVDATEVPWTSITPSPEDTRYWTQDFTLSSRASAPLEWTVLASLLHQQTEWNLNLVRPLAGVAVASVTDNAIDAYGLGGQATWSFGNALRLTAGTRYSSETKKIDALNAINGVVIASQIDRQTWTAWTPRFVAEYLLARGTFLYASATRGFKSGGYNTATISPAVKPETVMSYEVGFKSSALDNRVLLNAAAFVAKYEDMQLQFTTRTPAGMLVAVTRNAARATSKGVEFELLARPWPQLQLAAAAQFLNARFDEFIAGDPLAPEEGEIDRAGNPLPGAPDRTYSVAAQYTWPAAFAATDVTLRADVYNRSRVYYTTFKDPLASEDLGTIANVQLAFDPAAARGLYGKVFVKNVTDKRHVDTILASSTAGYVALYAPPRTAGVQVGYRY